MILTSPAFNDGETIPRKFTCDGGNINPELEIQNVPPAAQSLALILHDPDAPVPGGFTHWVMWNIAPATELIKEESIPPGSVEGNNGAGKLGYASPCPPIGHGVHHYEFYLYALDVAALDLPSGAAAGELESAMKGHVIEETKLVGLYSK
jgi:Raf kinase inhibitor-like YbhB/YbcL family protein